MTEGRILWHGMAMLCLVAMGVISTATAQNLIVGPGAIVLHQYRPGATVYVPNTYGYALPNPYRYVPLTGRRFPVYSWPRVQPYVAPPTPPQMAPLYAAPANPYRQYYTPHIPRYHRRKDSEPTQSNTVLRPRDSNSASDATEPDIAQPPATEPAPVESERVDIQKPGNSASTPEETDAPGPAERTRRPPRRRPGRYR